MSITYTLQECCTALLQLVPSHFANFFWLKYQVTGNLIKKILHNLALLVKLMLVLIFHLARNRGAMGSTIFVSGHVGVVLAFVFGTYFTYYSTPIFAIAVGVLFAFLLCFFPETPLFLAKQNKMEVIFFLYLSKIHIYTCDELLKICID